MIRRLGVLPRSMKKKDRRYAVSFEESVRLHSGKSPSYTRSTVVSWALCSLVPLLLNLSDGGGLCAWGIYGLLVTPIVMGLCGAASFPALVAQAITVSSFVNAFLSLFVPYGFLITVYVGIVVVGSLNRGHR